jgi:DNA adenine methylase
MKLQQPLKWHGGKSYLASWIHSLAPPHVSVDPDTGYTHRNIAFGGGLGEFWNWQPVEGVSEAANDLNRELFAFYAVLRGRKSFPQFMRMVEATPFGDRSFQHAEWFSKVDGSSSMLDRAYYFFVRYRMSRQGLGTCPATPTTRTRRGMNENVSAWLSAVDGLPECHERLRRVEVCNQPATKFIQQRDHTRALFYCDPPYEHSTRSSTGEYGEHEMSEADHDELLYTLNNIKGRFMLSGYHCPRYDRWAKRHNYNCHERLIANSASSRPTKETRVECIWTNY